MFHTEEEARVLILAPVGRDGPLLQAVLAQAGMASTVLPDGAALQGSLHQNVGAVLLTAEALAPTVLQPLRAGLAGQPEWSNTPLVLLVDVGDQEPIRRAVHRLLGSSQNLTILERPLSTRTVSELFQAILAGRRRQYQVRGLLAQLAVQNERLRQEVANRQQGEEQLRTLYRLSDLSAAGVPIEQIYDAALQALAHLLQVDRAAILLADAAGDLRFRAWRNLSAAYRRQAEGHSPWPASEQQPQPVLIPDVAQAEMGSLAALLREEGIAALAFIPLVEGGRLLGKFVLYCDEPHSFAEAEVQLAQTIARHVGHAVQRKQAEELLVQANATLEARVQERTAELERSNHDLDQFAYVASHDLKSPLRAIAQLAGWISEDAGDLLPAATRGHLAKLHGRIRRMETLLNDLLAYSRAGRQRHPPEPVEIATLIDSVVELLAPPPTFQVTVSAPLPPLPLERVPLEIALRNLISNAVKHHPQPDRGQVAVSAQAQDAQVQFTVSDNGAGIDPAFHQRIFEIFQTLRPRDEVEGSGMGLTVVKRLVESRGGTIQVLSSPGEGATFRFTWPVASAAR